MNDTPQNIKDLQLKIWLAKTPAERLKQFLTDNEVLFKMWKKAREEQNSKHPLSNKVT